MPDDAVNSGNLEDFLASDNAVNLGVVEGVPVSDSEVSSGNSEGINRNFFDLTNDDEDLLENLIISNSGLWLPSPVPSPGELDSINELDDGSIDISDMGHVDSRLLCYRRSPHSKYSSIFNY